MKPRGKTAGTLVERKVLKLLREKGWFAFRTPASLGVCDIVALKRGHVTRFVEVKSTTAGPYHGFGPQDRRELLDAAHLAGANALLAWWPPRKELRMIPASEWPLAIVKEDDLADAA